jgi:hypothetical protein
MDELSNRLYSSTALDEHDEGGETCVTRVPQASAGKSISDGGENEETERRSVILYDHANTC